MNLAKAIVWVAIVFVSAALAVPFHLPTPLTIVWSLGTVLICRQITKRADFSQTGWVTPLTTLEKWRLPVVIVSMPTSLLGLLVINSVDASLRNAVFSVGISATVLTVIILISYTLRDLR